MKLALLLAALIAPASLVFAQATPATPATPAAKPKTFSSSDKTFLKNSLASVFFLTQLAEKERGIERDNPVSDNLKKLARGLGGEGNKIWAEIAVIANDAGEPLPVKVKGSEKQKLDGLSKLKVDKLDKEFGELAAKESKDLLKIFESGAKSLQNPDLKAIAEKWCAAIKTLVDESTALSKTSGKKY